MRSSPDTSGLSVFLLPHADDEFAVACHIQDACRKGEELHAVFLTDGGFGGQNVARRENESRRVLQRLGVPENRIHFLGSQAKLPDGELHLHLSRAEAVVSQWLDRQGSCNALYFPAWEGGHQDHDAAHLLGLSLAKKLAPGDVAQFPLYRAVTRRWPLFTVMRRLKLIGPCRVRAMRWSERMGLLRLCLGYRSQWRSWMGLWPLLALHLMVDGCAYLYAADPRDVADSPDPDRPLYERRGFLRWSEFDAATRDYRDRLMLSVNAKDEAAGRAS